MNRTSILIGTVIFYTIFFGLLGFWNPSGLNEEESSGSNGFLTWLNSVGLDTTILDNIYQNVTGFPPIINIVVFTPMGLIVTWLIIELVVWITPFIGGGS